MNYTKDAKLKVVVVGAGIIGASIAWRLNGAGAAVTLVDGNAAGGIASANSFGWLNATYGNPRHYFDLRVASMKEWDVLAAQLENLPFKKSGTLYAHFDRVDLATFQQAHTKWGYEIDWIDHEQVRALEPNLISVPERCLLAPLEGTLRVDEAARVFAEHFQKQGGLFVNENVTAIATQGDQVTGVKVGGELIGADHVVIAAGAATQSLMAELNIHVPINTPAGLLVSTKPHRPIINRTILTNGLHIQQRPDGSLLAGTDFGGGQTNDHPEDGGVELIRRIRNAFIGAEDVELDRCMLGYRPVPADGMPVVGPVLGTPGIYVATMHSGATLAPIVSKYVCDELLTGSEITALEPFKPSRFHLKA